jgi:hypothetical protein
MPNKSIDMYKIRQILRLYADGRGSKFISSTTGIARNRVKKYLAQFESLGLSLQDIERMSDGQLASIGDYGQSVPPFRRKVYHLQGDAVSVKQFRVC